MVCELLILDTKITIIKKKTAHNVTDMPFWHTGTQNFCVPMLEPTDSEFVLLQFTQAFLIIDKIVMIAQ